MGTVTSSYVYMYTYVTQSVSSDDVCTLKKEELSSDDATPLTLSHPSGGPFKSSCFNVKSWRGYEVTTVRTCYLFCSYIAEYCG